MLHSRERKRGDKSIITLKTGPVEAPKSEETTNMTPETAWAEAMKFESRPQSISVLRRTAEDACSVRWGRHLRYHRLPGTHDAGPRPARQLRPASTGTGGSQVWVRVRSGVRGVRRGGDYDHDRPPPIHDKARRQSMRHFGPPHTPDLIPSMERDIQQLCDQESGLGS